MGLQDWDSHSWWLCVVCKVLPGSLASLLMAPSSFSDVARVGLDSLVIRVGPLCCILVCF